MNAAKRLRQYAEPVEITPAHHWDYRLGAATPTCSHFGCGRTLTLVESLCGQKCAEHSRPGKIVKKKCT